MSAAPTPAERRRDVIAAVVLVAGLIAYGHGYFGLRGLAMKPIVPVAGETAVHRATVFYDYTRVGVVLIIVGVAVVLWSFWRHWNARRNTGTR